MKKPHIWISDLTHTAQGISANTFPLGASYVYTYAKQQLGKDFNFKLFKFPDSLSDALKVLSPQMLCFSAYSWSFELSYKFASLAKKRDPNLYDNSKLQLYAEKQSICGERTFNASDRLSGNLNSLKLKSFPNCCLAYV
jgi:hypothetical protein